MRPLFHSDRHFNVSDRESRLLRQNYGNFNTFRNYGNQPNYGNNGYVNAFNQYNNQYRNNLYQLPGSGPYLNFGTPFSANPAPYFMSAENQRSYGQTRYLQDQMMLRASWPRYNAPISPYIPQYGPTIENYLATASLYNYPDRRVNFNPGNMMTGNFGPNFYPNQQQQQPMPQAPQQQWYPGSPQYPGYAPYMAQGYPQMQYPLGQWNPQGYRTIGYQQFTFVPQQQRPRQNLPSILTGDWIARGTGENRNRVVLYRNRYANGGVGYDEEPINAPGSRGLPPLPGDPDERPQEGPRTLNSVRIPNHNLFDNGPLRVLISRANEVTGQVRDSRYVTIRQEGMNEEGIRATYAARSDGSYELELQFTDPRPASYFVENPATGRQVATAIVNRSDYRTGTYGNRNPIDEFSRKAQEALDQADQIRRDIRAGRYRRPENEYASLPSSSPYASDAVSSYPTRPTTPSRPTESSPPTNGRENILNQIASLEKQIEDGRARSEQLQKDAEAARKAGNIGAVKAQNEEMGRLLESIPKLRKMLQDLRRSLS